MEMDTGEETTLLVINNRNRIPNKVKAVAVFLFVAVIAVTSIVSVSKSRSHRAVARIEVPIYDTNGTLLNASVPCYEAMQNVFVSQYLPNSDLYSDSLGGMRIFQPFPERCFLSKTLRRTKKNINTYRNVDMFYKRIASDTGISLNLVGKQTMGATLNVKTDSLSAGNTDVMGASVEIFTHTRSISIDQNCYKTSDGVLTAEILKDFDNLSVIIQDPSSFESWEMYDVFLKKFGTHFKNQVILGSSLRQWTFAKSSKSYKMESLKVKACLDLFGFPFYTPCSKVTKEAATGTQKLVTSSSIEIRGATDLTRNKLLKERTPELIERLLNEGRRMESPISYKYTPIWDIFLIKYGHNKKRYNIAMNMKQYYEGFVDFGCSPINFGKLKARRFKYQNDDNSQPIFQCELIHEGCRENSDCHVGPSTVASYCHGSTCFEYVDPPFGSKAESIDTRKERRGGYDEGINLSCHWRYGFDADCGLSLLKPCAVCDLNYGKNVIIWGDGSDPVHTKPVHSSANKALVYVGFWLWIGLRLALRLG